MNEHDPIDLLRAVRPRSAAIDVASDPTALSILHRTLDDGSYAPARELGQRTRRIAILGVVGVLAAGGTAAALVLHRDTPVEKRTLGCWSDATVPLPAEIVVVDWNGDDPVATCKAKWLAGAFDTEPSRQPPLLVACVTTAGALAVVPGNEATCATLNFATYVPGRVADDDLTTGALTAIENQITPAACLTSQDALQKVEEILHDAGLDDWTVVPPGTPFPAAEPCASAGFDVATMTVYIVPIARSSG